MLLHLTKNIQMLLDFAGWRFLRSIDCLFQPNIKLLKIIIIINSSHGWYLAHFIASLKQNSASIKARDMLESSWVKLLLYKVLINSPLIYIWRQVPCCIKIFSARNGVKKEKTFPDFYLVIKIVQDQEDLLFPAMIFRCLF